MSGSRESPWTFESERRRSSALGGGSVDGLPGAVSDEYGQCRSPLRDGLAPAR